MWPDALLYLIVRVIISTLEMTDDDGKPLTEPRRVTYYRELRPRLSASNRDLELLLQIDYDATTTAPLFPRFKIDERWLAACALKEIMCDELCHTVVKNVRDGKAPGEFLNGLEIQVAPEWRTGHATSSAVLKLAAKRCYNSAVQRAIEAELAKRKQARLLTKKTA